MCSCQTDQSRGCLCMWLQRQIKQIRSLLKNSNILYREVLPFLYKYIWIYLGFWKWVSCGRGTLWALRMVADKTGGSEFTKCTTPRFKSLLYIAATAMWVKGELYVNKDCKILGKIQYVSKLLAGTTEQTVQGSTEVECCTKNPVLFQVRVFPPEESLLMAYTYQEIWHCLFCFDCYSLWTRVWGS